MAQRDTFESREEEEQAAEVGESAPQQVSQGTGIPPCEMALNHRQEPRGNAFSRAFLIEVEIVLAEVETASTICSVV